MSTPLTHHTSETATRRRILAIDDDPQIRSLLVAFLRRDYVVAVANDGLEGFSKATEFPPDIAIIDIQMPGWDGLTTLEKFRSDPRLKTVRIIMLTADASRQTVMAAISLGADDYIVKTSLTRHDLLSKIERVARRQTTSMPAPVCQLPAREPARAVSLAAATAPATSATSPTLPASSMREEAHAALVGSTATAVAATEGRADAADARLQELLDAWE